MEEKAVGGVRWTILTYAVSKVITFGATVVLARILEPRDFGVVMLAFVAMNVVGVFGDLGLGATLVVRQDLDRKAMGTVLTLLLGSGAALAVMLVAVAPLLSRVFDEPRLTRVLVALAPLTAIASFNWFFQWLFQRELEFKKRFVGFAGQTVAYAVVAITAALLGAGVWSIVAGHLVGHVAMAAVYVTVTRPVRPSFDGRLARDLLRTSKGFMLQSAARLLRGSADYAAVGRTLGSAQLGLYSMAYRLAELLHLAIADPVAKVTFPGFSRMRQRGEAVGRQHLDVLRLVAMVTFPIGALLSALAAPLTRAVYGPQWVGMAAALSVRGVWGAVRCIHATVEWLLNSVGGQNVAAMWAVAVLVVELPLMFVAADRRGIAGVSWVLLVAVTVSLVPLVINVRARIGVGIIEHVGALLPATLASTGAWFVARVVHTGTSDDILAVALPGVAGAVTYVAALLLLAPRSVRRAVGQLRRAGFGSADAGSEVLREVPPATSWPPAGDGV